MTTTVVGDAAVAAGRQEEHLVLKSVCTQRPAVAKDYWLSGSPVIEIDLRTVLRLDCTHVFLCCFLTSEGEITGDIKGFRPSPGRMARRTVDDHGSGLSFRLGLWFEPV